jgi:hypothetical protein
MNTLIYNRLIELARAERLTTYSDVAPLAGLSMDNEVDRNAISEILMEIARHERMHGRPMLTSLVVHRGNDNNPGEGFFAAAVEFGRYSGARDPFTRLEFWMQEVKAVHVCWARS